VQTPLDSNNGCGFAAFVDNLPSESVISEESTPKDMDMEMHTAAMAQLQLQLQDNTDDDEDTVSSSFFRSISHIFLLACISLSVFYKHSWENPLSMVYIRDIFIS